MVEKMNQIIHTNDAPAAVGTYSQAVKNGQMVFLSGQIGLDPATGELVSDEFKGQVEQIFKNISAVIAASGGSLDNIVKFTVFLLDMTDFPTLNELMSEWLSEPYPARSAVGAASLPCNAKVEIETVLMLP